MPTRNDVIFQQDLTRGVEQEYLQAQDQLDRLEQRMKYNRARVDDPSVKPAERRYCCECLEYDERLVEPYRREAERAKASFDRYAARLEAVKEAYLAENPDRTPFWEG